MGVLNITSDSFSDGGEFLAAESAVRRALEMIDQGADILDIGAESTRPGASPVSPEEQMGRVVGVIETLREHDAAIPISIDTRSAVVAEAALCAGADMVNDVSALRDEPDLAEIVRHHGAVIVLMHMRGTPADMQSGGGPCYDDVVREVGDFLLERRSFAVNRGVAREKIVFDPGLGFGKRVDDNLAIMKQLDEFVLLGQPLLVGASRKSFIGHVLDIEDPKHRVAGSLACAAMAVVSGASIIRAHDVRETVEVVKLCAEVMAHSSGVRNMA